jgi:DNA polymerase III sliding clamp (beta) subunit (PCNA family)
MLKMFHAVFKEAFIFKKVIETLKDLVTEDFNLIASPTKLSFLAVDSQKQALVSFSMGSEAFELYACSYQRLKLGVSVAYLKKAMRLW